MVVDAIEVPQAEHLEAARVGQHRAVPAHKSMQAPGFGHHLLTRLQMQVIGVREHHLGACLRQLFSGHTFNRAEGAHGHESRRGHRTMGCVKAATARLGVAAVGVDLKTEHGPNRGHP